MACVFMSHLRQLGKGIDCAFGIKYMNMCIKNILEENLAKKDPQYLYSMFKVFIMQIVHKSKEVRRNNVAYYKRI
jgi:hypothetical protein